jgi:hypothetical protein
LEDNAHVSSWRYRFNLHFKLYQKIRQTLLNK